MWRRVSWHISWPLAGPLLLAILVGGCRLDFEEQDPWRAEAEEKCLAEGRVVASAFIEPVPAIDGPGACGMKHPLKVSALSEGNVALEPAGRFACPVLSEVEAWMTLTVQPAAQAWFGQPVAAVRQMSSYSCRSMNGQEGAKISEHAFGNALDIGAFKLQDGRWITIKDGWKGKPDERGFLLQVQAGACERFTTVLAPGSNIFHYDHIHVDLMRHQAGRTICKPAPRLIPGPALKAPPMARMPAAAPPPVAASVPQQRGRQFEIVQEPARIAPPPPPMAAAVPRDGGAGAGVQRSGAPPLPAAAPVRDVPAARSRPAPMEPPPASARSAPPPRVAPRDGVPPGWQVGPEGMRPPAPVAPPMSYAPGGHPGGIGGKGHGDGQDTETGSATRRYYLAPTPQAPTIPLPRARPGED